MPHDLPYREFLYPLNVFMYVLSHEEGGVRYLHYGLFDSPGDTIADAQERSTELLLERLPAPPAKILEAGLGLGTTLARLTRSGYDALGITPDAKQIAMVRERYGDLVRTECVPFESYAASETFDCVLFQESAQYIDAAAIFSKAAELTSHVLVADEFAMEAIDEPGALHSYARFIDEAGRHGFRVTEEIDLSRRAAPTVDYFMERLPRYRDELTEALGIEPQQIEDLIASGGRYRDLYRRGVYGYRLIALRR
ncbi:MAG TPA: class I SAM-dependent methyltransferase [Thermoanaerobaculia bacterium]